MTAIKPLSEIQGDIQDLIESKDNPDEWYVLNGRHVGEYSVHTDEKPPEYDEVEAELPPEDRDATENVDGFYQIGTLGWTADAFADDCGFVGAFMGRSTDPLDTRVLAQGTENAVTVDEPERLLEDGETSLTAFADGGDQQ